ncbi:hypothetical protein AVEN_220838-1 [Araneus ventricosus]|uniref:Uncharacterized protein n=1 Tax=Araneus ventricosus TaxID=182803 RepID=A0A4Y2FQ44_ARAVE|nr:hypothetical protein AVEN_220838-1 [Araneus ventricosus]
MITRSPISEKNSEFHSPQPFHHTLASKALVFTSDISHKKSYYFGEYHKYNRGKYNREFFTGVEGGQEEQDGSKKIKLLTQFKENTRSNQTYARRNPSAK